MKKWYPAVHHRRPAPLVEKNFFRDRNFDPSRRSTVKPVIATIFKLNKKHNSRRPRMNLVDINVFSLVKVVACFRLSANALKKVSSHYGLLQVGIEINVYFIKRFLIEADRTTSDY